MAIPSSDGRGLILTNGLPFDHWMSGVEFLNGGSRKCLTQGGVYTIWVRQECQYVGMSTTNMNSRLSTHVHGLQPMCSADPRDITIAAHFCEHPAYTELLYIYTLKPRLNRETKGLFP